MTTTQETPTIDKLLIRKRDGGYKSEAARAIGVSRQIYDAWESTHFVPGDEWVESLAEYLDWNIDDIVLTLYRSRVAKSRFYDSLRVMGLATHEAYLKVA